MPLLFDEIVAGVVATTVLFLLASLQVDAMNRNAVQSMRTFATSQGSEMSRWLQKDLDRIGKNMDRKPIPIKTYELPSNDSVATWLTKRFTFARDSISPSGTIVPIRVRYRLQKTGTRPLGDKTLGVYRLVREEKIGGGSWTPAGRVRSLAYFDVDLLNRHMRPIRDPLTHLSSEPDTVRSVRIRFAIVPPTRPDRKYSVPPLAASRSNTIVASYLPADPWGRR